MTATAPPLAARAGLEAAPEAPPQGRAQAATVAVVVFVCVGVALRWYGLGHDALNLDESFTAMAGRRDVGNLLGFLRAYDSHPPLDYLLRAPLARSGASDALMRVPSVVFSSAALILFAWWLRQRAWLGAIAVAFMAVSGYQLAYGREARMYALLQLLGVLSAIVATSWLAHPSRRLAGAAGAVVLFGVFDHVSGLLLAAGLLCLAGLRRDRDAWEWRVAVGSPVVLWCVAWGPALMEQSKHDHTPAPRTSFVAFADVIGHQVTREAGLTGFVLIAVAAGCAALWRLDRRRCTVVLTCGVVPLALAALVGIATPVLIPRFVVVTGWFVPLALAALAVWAAKRSVVLGAAVVLVLAVLLVPTTTYALGGERPVDRAVGRLDRVVADGDVIAVSPAWLYPIVDWHLGVHRDGVERVVTLRGYELTHTLRLGDGPASGRVWLLEPIDAPVDVPGMPCARPWTDGVSRVRCLQQ